MNVAVFAWAIPVLVVALILILVADRRGDDAAGYRTPARYLGAACFLAVFLTLFSTFGVVAQLSRFVISHDRGSSLDVGAESFSSFGGRSLGDRLDEQSDNAIWRGTVQFGLLAVASAGVLVFHRRKRDALRAAPGFLESGASRADHAYLYTACFVAVFLVLFAAFAGVYGLFKVVAPGVASVGGGASERERGIAQAISFGALALGSLAVFVLHWREVPRRDLLAPRVPAGPPVAPPVAPTA
jgi:hypothetical protein